MTTVYVPRDSAALSVGAADVAAAILQVAGATNASVALVRNGSRGMFWLEPFIEVETSAGRIGYGPVSPEDVPGMFQSGFLAGSPTSSAWAASMTSPI